EGIVVEQLIRPTGLLDPIIIVRPSLNQIDDLLEEISQTIQSNQRVLVTTLTKRMAEELTKYLHRLDIKSRYIHSDVDTLERVEIMRGLRLGEFDVLVGVNLLREGLDLPEVSLVAILDADKEGFLRSERSLTQTAGRAARNVNSKVIMYADKITNSMQRTIDETDRKREKQLLYNEKNGITPTSIIKSMPSILGQSSLVDIAAEGAKAYPTENESTVAADPVVQYMSVEALKKAVQRNKKAMQEAVKTLDFIEAAHLRDEIAIFEQLINEKTK
ncbi:MAG: helicase-related protein, partial [Ignavibacteria bacterium]|nr:helicase-related protein [Ignavibacteria bacterium]